MRILMKIAWKNMKKSKIVFLSALQLTICFVITVIMVSSLSIRFSRYSPIKDYLNADGLFCLFATPANEDITLQNIWDYLDDTEIQAKLSKVDDVLAVNYPYVYYNSENPDQYRFNKISYNDSLIKCYTPELSEGRWLNVSTNSSELEIVISENNYDWKIGDKIPLLFYNLPDCTIADATIVGILKDESKIPGSLTLNQKDFNDFYMTYSTQIEEIPLIILNSDFLRQNSNICQGEYCANIIKYKAGITDSERKENREILIRHGAVFTEENSIINANSKNYLYSEAYNLLPIIIVLIGMILISTFSFTALTTRKRLKDYSIFYIEGLQWSQCYRINLLQCAYISLLSLIMAFILLIVLKNIISYAIIINFLTLTFIAVEIIIFYIIAFVMPFMLISKNTPKEILTR